MAYNNSNSNQQKSAPQPNRAPYQGKPSAGGRPERKPSILLFKATDKETGEPKVSKGGKEYFRVVLTADQVKILQDAQEGCALYMEEQSGTSKKTGRDYSGYAISVLPKRD